MTEKQQKTQNVLNYFKIEKIEDLDMVLSNKVYKTFETIDSDDSMIYNSFHLIIEELRKEKNNPLRKSILLYTTIWNAVFGNDYEDISILIENMGIFKTYLILDDLFKENLIAASFIKLFNSYEEKVNSPIAIIGEDIKNSLDLLNKKLSSLDINDLKNLMSEFMTAAEETGIASKLSK